MSTLEYQEGRTELDDLGEFALIERLTEGFETYNKTTCKGVGDDCAVIGEGNVKTLVTVNTMAEGVHFDMMYTPLKHLGYKSVASSLSNIAAMNGKARQIEVSIAVSNRYSVEALEELYAGIRLCCNRYDVDLVGGSTVSSRSGMVLTVTAIGEVQDNKISYRSGAKLHDLICVSGDLGSAYSGLLILEREKVTYQANPNFQPDLDSYDYVLERFLKPEPRLDIIAMLAEKDVVPTSMIDVADGLASELLHICHSSHCGCEVYEEKIPIDYQTTRVCTELSRNMLPVSNALNGGGDYELLFTIDQKDYDKIKDMDGVHIIGHITEEGSPAVMVTPQNSTITLVAQGFREN
ncbi:MAG: thiamine-phosphate kinase [Bacteroidales bacterium]|nr:thiamine-phosphate kinase [Bacteroidales bacterium]